MEKGAIAGVGGFIMLAIALIVGAILLQSSAQNTNDVVNTFSVANRSLGAASNSTTVYLTDMKAISSVVIVNSTNGAVVGSGNYTVTNNVVYNGALAVSVLPTTPADSGFSGYVWNISGTAQPTAYADSAGRSLTNLIIVMMALALVAIAVGYAVKSYSD